MNNDTARKELNALLEQLRLEQTIEDMQAEIDGRTRTTSQGSVNKAMARVHAMLDDFALGKPFGARALRAKVAQPAKSALSWLSAGTADLLGWMRDNIENLGGAYGGTPKVASASTGQGTVLPAKLGRDHETAADRSWRQGDLVFSLYSVRKEEFIVTLKVEGDTSEKPARLCLVDVASIKGSPDESPNLKWYQIEPWEDGTYRVRMPVGIYSNRMRAIVSAEKSPGSTAADVVALMPIVEMG